MCGIIGYVGNKNSITQIMEGLTSLEYRGYDSSGMSIIKDNKIFTIKEVGKVEKLKNKINPFRYVSHIGIGHTRWATHGEVTLENTHPHNSTDNRISVVHNGIIENYLEIKEELLAKNVSFIGKTDTEVIVKYLEKIYDGNPLDSIYKLSKKIKGSYALAILFLDYPNSIFFLKKDSPLLIGYNKNEVYLSSDYTSISDKIDNVVYLKDNQYGYIQNDDIRVYIDRKPVKYKTEKTNFTYHSTNENKYSTYLEKEINETSLVAKSIISRYIKNNKIDFSSHSFIHILPYISHINILGCGSSYNVGLIGKYLFESLSGISTSVSIASEYKYSNKIHFENTMNILISQSGETADLISCIPYLNKYKLGIINVRNSTISSLCDDNLYLDSGPEISVATTKAYIGQLTFLYLLSIQISYSKKKISSSRYIQLIKELKAIPGKIQYILNNHNEIKLFSNELSNYGNVFFIGRGLDYLTCIEGSLKLKEVTYIHSEAIASGELKHGTISLIDPNVYTIALLSSSLKNKTMSNIEEVKSRNGKVFTISDENSNYVIPKTIEIFYPLLQIIPLQLLSLYTGANKKLDIDKPRNLAKSVTVE